MSNEKVKYLKVARNTPVQALATSIVSAYREDTERTIVIRSVGPVPLNQAVKAVIVANKDFIKTGLTAVLMPSFATIPLPNIGGVGDKENTAIELKVELKRV
jgi:stage V sporulation protein SpoVS